MTDISGGLFLITIIGLIGFAMGCFVFVGMILHTEIKNNWKFNKKETLMFGIILLIGNFILIVGHP